MSRIAMVSVHACPLAKLGGRDSGGMNVYVRELARELGRRGHEVDVFTRWREKDDPRIQSLGPNARVVHIQSGPMGYWPKMDVYEHLDEFTAKLGIVSEEADESVFWLKRLLNAKIHSTTVDLPTLLAEAEQLARIFGTSHRTAKRRKRR